MTRLYKLLSPLIQRIYLPGKSKSKFATCIGIDLTVHQINMIRHCLDHYHAFPEEMSSGIREILESSVIVSVEASPTGEERDLSVVRHTGKRLPVSICLDDVADEIEKEWVPWMEYKDLHITKDGVILVFEGEDHEYRYELSTKTLMSALES